MNLRHSMLMIFVLLGVGLGAGLLAFSAPSAAQDSAPAAAPAANYAAPIVQDSWVDANQPAGNFGGVASLHVGLVVQPATGLLGERQTLVQFDLSGLPTGANIVKATLQLYQVAASGFDAYQVRPDAAAAGWQEAAVTWNNKPPNPNLGDPAITLDYAAGWKQWDVTQTVRAWHNGQAPNFGFVLAGVNPVGVPPAERVFSAGGGRRDRPHADDRVRGGRHRHLHRQPNRDAHAHGDAVTHGDACPDRDGDAHPVR